MPGILGGSDLNFTNGSDITLAKLTASSAGFAVSTSGGNVQLTGLSAPVGAFDATNKAYVDGLVQGLSVRDSVRLATAVAGVLANDFENGDFVDGVQLVTGDRILLKDQANAVENGIYVVKGSGAPERAGEGNSPSSGWLDDNAAAASVFVFVQEGTSHADSGFTCTNPSGTGSAGDIVGTGELAFTQFSNAGNVEGRLAINKVGNYLDFSGGDIGAIGIKTTGKFEVGTVDATNLQIDGHVVNSTAAELNILSGVTATSAEINKLGGYTGDAADLNLLDTAEANLVKTGKAVIYGTSGQVAATTVSATGSITSSGGNISAAGNVSGVNVTASGDLSVPLSNLKIGGTAVNSTAAELNILSGVTATSAEINKLGGYTGDAADLNLLDTAEANLVKTGKAVIYGTSGQVAATTVSATGNISTTTGDVSGVNVTASGDLSVPLSKLKIGGAAVTSSATELNFLKGATKNTTVTGKAVIYGDSGAVTAFKMTATTTMNAQSFVASSDRTLKQDIKPISGPAALDAVGKMVPCSYQFKASPKDQRCGVIAQELQKIAPELVKKTEAGTLAVDYNDMNAYLIGAIQQLKGQNDAQAATISRLQADAAKSAACAKPAAQPADIAALREEMKKMRTDWQTMMRRKASA